MINANPPQAIPAVLLAICLMSLALGADDAPAPSAQIGSAAELFTPAAPVPKSNRPTSPGAPALTQPEAPKVGNGTGTVDSSGPFDAPIWSSLKRADRERRRLKSQSEQDWGFVESDFIWQAPEPGYDSPFERGEWKTEDLFAVPVTGPLYLFTGVEMGGQYAADQSMKVIGRTGVLWKMPLGDGTALEVRGGPSLRYNDVVRSEKGRDQGSMEWEVKAKCPLIGPFNLEYLGEALPALTPEERSQLKQDLNLFIPVSGGKVKFGAKHQWEPGQAEARTATGLMQLYMGIEIGR